MKLLYPVVDQFPTTNEFAKTLQVIRGACSNPRCNATFEIDEPSDFMYATGHFNDKERALQFALGVNCPICQKFLALETYNQPGNPRTFSARRYSPLAFSINDQRKTTGKARDGWDRRIPLSIRATAYRAWETEQTLVDWASILIDPAVVWWGYHHQRAHRKMVLRYLGIKPCSYEEHQWNTLTHYVESDSSTYVLDLEQCGQCLRVQR